MFFCVLQGHFREVLAWVAGLSQRQSHQVRKGVKLGGDRQSLAIPRWKIASGKCKREREREDPVLVTLGIETQFYPALRRRQLTESKRRDVLSRKVRLNCGAGQMTLHPRGVASIIKPEGCAQHGEADDGGPRYCFTRTSLQRDRTGGTNSIVFKMSSRERAHLLAFPACCARAGGGCCGSIAKKQQMTRDAQRSRACHCQKSTGQAATRGQSRK